MIEGKEFEARRMLKYGMVGGGPGSFIGCVHRTSIALGGVGTLVAGCFSDIQEEIDQAGRELGLDPSRVYRNFSEMAEMEAKLDDKIDFVVIVTPNRVHYSAAKAFLEKGFHVVCEKPLTIDLEEALELKRLATANSCLFCVSYTYTGHVMAKEAREIVMSGEIGEIMVVMGEYPQEWLIDTLEKDAGQRQAVWRTDPKISGKSNCLGDIGTHIENMVSYITGLRIKQVCASMDIFGAGRTLDTNSEVLIRFENGARGTYWCSQVAAGYDNGLKVRVFGTLGSVEFDQEQCNYLKVTKKGHATERYSRGNGYLHPKAKSFSRIPAGHPEGYFEAYANLYSSFGKAIQDKLEGKTINEADYDYPGLDEGIDGVRFVEKCVESSSKGTVWVDMD